MEKARRELDEVVGRTRMPSFEDIPELPYLQAMTKELLRWRPVVPQGGILHFYKFVMWISHALFKALRTLPLRCAASSPQ